MLTFIKFGNGSPTGAIFPIILIVLTAVWTISLSTPAGIQVHKLALEANRTFEQIFKSRSLINQIIEADFEIMGWIKG